MRTSPCGHHVVRGHCPGFRIRICLRVRCYLKLTSHAAAAGRRQIVCAGSVDTFQVFTWSLKTGRLLEVLAGHEGPVAGLAFNPDLPFLASASWDRTVRRRTPAPDDPPAMAMGPTTCHKGAPTTSPPLPPFRPRRCARGTCLAGKAAWRLCSTRTTSWPSRSARTGSSWRRPRWTRRSTCGTPRRGASWCSLLAPSYHTMQQGCSPSPPPLHPSHCPASASIPNSST